MLNRRTFFWGRGIWLLVCFSLRRHKTEGFGLKPMAWVQESAAKFSAA